MDEQKAFMRSYRLSVSKTADRLLDIILYTASCEDFSPELFLDDVIKKMNAIYKKEAAE